MFNFEFWQSFLSNLFATFIGAALGIPVALYVNGLLEKSSEAERKRKILVLLRAELNENLELIKNWTHSPNLQESVAIIGHDIKTEAWTAFSDGGEIQWIKDPELLGKLSNAFFRLKNLRELGDWNDLILFHSTTTQESAKNRMWERLMQKPDACVEAVSIAISSIDDILQHKA